VLIPKFSAFFESWYLFGGDLKLVLILEAIYVCLVATQSTLPLPKTGELVFIFAETIFLNSWVFGDRKIGAYSMVGGGG